MVLIVAGVIFLARETQRQLTPVPEGGARLAGGQYLSPANLYFNVIASQVLVVALLGVLAWYTAMPLAAFGIGGHGHSVSWQIGVGIALGIFLYGLNEGSVLVLDRFGIGYSEALRGALAPSSGGGWGLLLVGVLPIIAAAEEIVFRAALIGAVEAGYGLSPLLLAVLSSIAFALGHGVQGPGGILVTGALGFVLALAFIGTGSLLLVVVAHYVVNSLEFLVHEGLGVSLV